MHRVFQPWCQADNYWGKCIEQERKQKNKVDESVATGERKTHKHILELVLQYIYFNLLLYVTLCLIIHSYLLTCSLFLV